MPCKGSIPGKRVFLGGLKCKKMGLESKISSLYIYSCFIPRGIKQEYIYIYIATILKKLYHALQGKYSREEGFLGGP